jgi:hypothetical protein
MTRESYVHLGFHVAPLLATAQHGEKFVERRLVLGSELEPREEVERFAQLARLVKAARNAREVWQRIGDVT